MFSLFYSIKFSFVSLICSILFSSNQNTKNNAIVLLLLGMYHSNIVLFVVIFWLVVTHMLARLFNQPVFGYFEINGWWRCLLRNCFRFCLIWQYFTIHTTVYVCVSRYFLIPALYNEAVTGSFGSICSFSFSSVFKIFFMFIFLSLVLFVSPFVKGIIDFVLSVSTSLFPAEP